MRLLCWQTEKHTSVLSFFSDWRQERLSIPPFYSFYTSLRSSFPSSFFRQRWLSTTPSDSRTPPREDKDRYDTSARGEHNTQNLHSCNNVLGVQNFCTAYIYCVGIPSPTVLARVSVVCWNRFPVCYLSFQLRCSGIAKCRRK